MSGKRLTLVVLAAGLGSRFGGAKQVAAVGPTGETIVDYSIYDALRAGFTRVVFIVREDLEAAVRSRFDRALAGRCATRYVVQRLCDLPTGFVIPSGRVRPWGTGHAIFCCRHVLDGPFAVVNADDFYGAAGFESLADLLAETPQRDPDEHGLVGYPIEGTLTTHGAVARGICRVGVDGYLESIVERRLVAVHNGRPAFSEDGAMWLPLPPETLASMNLWGFKPSLLVQLEAEFVRFLRQDTGNEAEFRIPSAIGNLLDRGVARVRVLPTAEQWLGVTYRDDLPAVRDGIARRVAEGRYPASLWSGRSGKAHPPTTGSDLGGRRSEGCGECR